MKRLLREWNWKRHHRQLQTLELLVMDVDGVLTDGGLWLDGEGQLKAPEEKPDEIGPVSGRHLLGPGDLEERKKRQGEQGCGGHGQGFCHPPGGHEHRDGGQPVARNREVSALGQE